MATYTDQCVPPPCAQPSTRARARSTLRRARRSSTCWSGCANQPLNDSSACLSHACYCRDQDPTLTFHNGRFRPAHSIASPAPPPPPTPPPLYVLYRTPPPPPFPPTPSPPPPWYAHAETCFPITTAAENELEVADGLERAVCVYVRAISNERVRADKCFGVSSPS